MSVLSTEELLLGIANSVSALLAFVDRDARYVWVNEAYREWCGFAPDDVKGRHASEVLGEKPWVAVRQYVERALTGEAVTFETRMEYQGGPARDVSARYVPQFDAGGAVIGFIILVHDVSERVRAERSLELSQQMAHVGSWELDLTSGTTTKRWSAETFRIFGYEPDSIVPTSELFFAAVHPDDLDRMREVSRTARMTGASFEIDHRIVRPDGTVRFVHEWVRVELDASLRAVRLFGTCQDVTEHRENARRLERAMDELRMTSRRKDEFLAMLSHELRNPLAPIISAIQLLELSSDEVSADTGELYGILSRQTAHMRRLLDDLLEVSRLSRGKITLQRSRLELGPILAQAMEVSAPLIRAKKHQLVTDICPHTPTVNGDSTRLVQVFANLLDNAARYTDSGGAITVSAQAENDRAVIRVRDTGVGMSEELIGRAFDLFAQESRAPDRSQGGLGIGLTMVRGLVELHGGSVRAHSDGPGRGSELIVSLPLDVATGASAPP